MKTRMRRVVGLLVVALAATTSVSRADQFVLQSDVWGDTTAPDGWKRSNGDYGSLPGASDDASARVLCEPNAPCANLFLRQLLANGGQPIAASVRSFDGAGRRLVVTAGGSLETQRESQVSGLTMTGGQVTTFSTFTVLRTMTVNDGGAVTPSIITTPNSGKFVLLGDTDVQGTLHFRATLGEVQNNGTFALSGAGNVSLWFGHDFRNRAGGAVDIRNDNGIAVVSPQFDLGPTPIQFWNEAGATLMKSSGSGTSVVEAPIVNAGRVVASSGQLNLAGGGTHAQGASLEATGTGTLSLVGSHTVTGVVSTSGDGFVALGGGVAASSMSIGSGGTLANTGRFSQFGELTVGAGGKIDQAGAFGVYSVMRILAGGTLENSGSLQVEGSLINEGSVTVKRDSFVLGVAATGAYTQQAGTTVIESGGNVDLPGSYLQTGGETKVNGTLRAGTVDFEGGVLSGGGTVFGDVTLAPAVQNAFSGSINPGNSPGLLTIDGNLVARNAIFNIEIAGPLAGTSFDQLFVTGDALLGGGVVNFSFLDGFLPAVGDSFEWLKVGGTLSFLEDDPLALSITSSIGTVFGELDPLGRFYVTDVVGGGGGGVPAVPEPGTLALLALALAGLSLSRRRRA